MNSAIDLNNIESYWKRRETISTKSGTTVDRFKPVIPWQHKCLTDIRLRYDYKVGYHEVLLSGSVGSAKSIFLAHLIISHCIMFEKACVGVFRMSMPDLRDTIFKDLVDHLECESLVEGKDYSINNTRCQIHFRNGSSIISRSFTDKKYTKVRSMRLSMAVFEEFIEFDEHEQAVKEVRNRLGRCPWVPECLLISATNPSDPSSWIYQYYVEGSKDHETRHVYYSLTFDNPFLSKSYIMGIMRDLDEKQVLRMIFGRWIELRSDIIYHQFGDYNQPKSDYVIDPRLPIHISWDFNIGQGKPLSCCAFQVVRKDMDTYTYHFFHEVVIEGMRTLDSCEEIGDSGLLDNYGKDFYIHGDASGANNDTRSKKSDYDIIMGYFQNYVRKDGSRLNIIKKVPLANPPIRSRHNRINGLCKNVFGETFLFVYKQCKTLIKGLKLTKLKDNGSLIEDDSKEYQHVTTALGYGIIAAERFYKNQDVINAAIARRNTDD